MRLLRPVRTRTSHLRKGVLDRPLPCTVVQVTGRERLANPPSLLCGPGASILEHELSVYRGGVEATVNSSWVHGAKGGTRLKTLLVLLIIFALVYGSVKLVPVYVTNYELQDSMQEQATFASVNRTSADKIKSDLEKKLHDLGITADPNSLQVTSDVGNVSISFEYTVPVDLTVYQLQLHFHPHADNASL